MVHPCVYIPHIPDGSYKIVTYIVYAHLLQQSHKASNPQWLKNFTWTPYTVQYITHMYDVQYLEI